MSRHHDLIIRNAALHNGLGDSAIISDLAVSKGRITRIGEMNGSTGEIEMDAGGRALAPGFIDTHTHDDRAVALGALSPKISQGVTTVVTGNCGFSLAPFDWSRPRPSPLNHIMREPQDVFASFDDWFNHLQNTGISPNVVALIGHSTLRAMVMADPSKPASESKIVQMEALLEKALSDGVFGMSTGLEYGPAINSETSEIIRLAAMVARRGGIYTTHMRDEGDEIIAAMDEAFEVGTGAKIRVLISHFKCAGLNNFGRSSETIAHFEAARKNIDVALDAYPYDACSTELRLDFVKKSHRVLIAESHKVPDAAGRDFAELVAEWNISPAEAIERLDPAMAVYFDMDEQDVRAILSYRHTMIGSDGIPESEKPHPRLWGTFARVIGHYARDLKLFTLEEAIRRMTSLPAGKFGLDGRGVLKEGAIADLVLFDASKILDTATFEDPIRPAAGIDTVWVGGTPVWQNGASTPARPGKVLKLSPAR